MRHDLRRAHIENRLATGPNDPAINGKAVEVNHHKLGVTVSYNNCLGKVVKSVHRLIQRLILFFLILHWHSDFFFLLLAYLTLSVLIVTCLVRISFQIGAAVV